MTYAEIVRVRAPREAYDAMHSKIGELLDGTVPEGAILHVARATEDGFEVLEVWGSKDQADAFNRDVLPRAMEKLGAPPSDTEPEVVAFEPITTITFAVYDSDQAQ